jgi:hypothetical protein
MKTLTTIIILLLSINLTAQKVTYNTNTNEIKVNSNKKFYSVEIESTECYSIDKSFSSNIIAKKYLRGFNKTVNIDKLDSNRYIRVVVHYAMSYEVFVIDTNKNINNI